MMGTTYGDIRTVTPDDNAKLDPIPHGLYVGGAGNLVVETMKGDVVTFFAVPAGTLLPISVRRVKSTGTGASSIVALGG